MNKTPCYSEESKDTFSDMANATTAGTSYTQENSEDDECRENIPPGITSTSQSLKLEVQTTGIDNSEGCASTEQEADFESCISSTPAPANNNVKTKSRLSGIQSALTPILKYLNIGNKGSSPETLAEGNNSGRSSTKTARALSQQSKVELTSSCARQPPGDTEVCWLADECLPDITLLDVTCDTTMLLAKNDSALPDSLPSTPVRAHPLQTFTPKPSPNIPQKCLLKNTQCLLPQTVGCHTESDPAGNATALKNTSLVLKQSSLDAEKVSFCAMQEATFDKQESSITGPSTICTLSSNPPKMEVTSTMSNTSSHDSHHSSWEKLSFSEVCSGDGSQAQAEPTEMSKYDENTPSKHPTTKMSNFPQSIDAPLCFLDSRFFPEITLLDVTCDTVFSPQSKTPSIKAAPNIPSTENLKNTRLSSEKNLDVTQELSTSNLVQNEDSASPVDGSVDNKPNSCGEQSGKCVGENIPKASLETTRDISMGSFLENSRPSAESSSQSLEKTHTPVMEAVFGNPANLTHDISSSSLSCAPSGTQCNMSTKNATFELHEPSTSMNTVREDHPQSLDSDLSSKENQLNQKSPESENGTFIIAEQASNLSANSATPMPRSQNQTLELPSDPKVKSETKDEPMLARNDTSRTPPAVSPNCPSVEPSAPCAAQNVTFERHSLQRSTNSIILEEAAATTSDLQNNTFDIKSSKQNATITMCDTSSSDSQQRSTLEKPPPPPEGCPVTGSPKGDNSEVLLSTKHNGTKNDATSEAKTNCTPKGKCKSDPSIHGDSDVSVHQSIGLEENRGTFCLDESLDLREDHLITSTPMVDSKMFNLNVERDQGKIMLAQKKLYRDPPGMPNSQLPSNIVSDRKTFLTQPVMKSLQPPLKAASQLLMKKPTSIPGRPEPLMSGVPVTRLRSQTEALRASVSDAAQVATKGMSCYNLRTTTAGSKHPVSGIQKPRSNFLQSGIQRAPQALRPPAAKYAPAVSASTDNHQVPAASNPVMKIPLAKKHHVFKGEALPISKKRKMDVLLPSETLTSSCASMNGTKNLKRPATSHKPLPLKTPRVDVPANTTEMPTSCNDVSKVRALKQPATKQISQLPKPQGNGCAKCTMLEEQLQIQSEEIRRLKELLKYTKPAQD